MTASLFDHDGPHPEPSTLVAFAQNRLDRRSEYRGEAELPAALAAGETRFFAICGDRLVMRIDDDAPEGLLHAAETALLDPDHDNAILLGWTEAGAAMVAVPVGLAAEALPEPFKALDGRSVYRQQLLAPELQGAYAQACSLAQWARSNCFCGRCGGTMKPEAGGYRRRCESCGALAFPRTDPVAIMLVVDEASDRCLLGRSAHFPPGMFSCLAGFVEPGETLEDAVRRETAEESGIRVGRVRYHASQPWPMPHSLMIGCFGEALNREIARDTTELADCRWFTRAETEAMLQSAVGDAGQTPPPGAIANRLMRDWIDWKR